MSARTDDALLACAGLSKAELAEVLDLIAGTDIAELELSTSGTRLSVRRRPVPLAGRGSGHTASGTPAESPSLAITSPLVGIFRPTVTTGDVVQSGQSIGAIEALGMPTTVDAPQSGTVEDLLAPDGTAVEYGQPLLVLRRAP